MELWAVSGCEKLWLINWNNSHVPKFVPEDSKQTSHSSQTQISICGLGIGLYLFSWKQLLNIQEYKSFPSFPCGKACPIKENMWHLWSLTLRTFVGYVRLFSSHLLSTYCTCLGTVQAVGDIAVNNIEQKVKYFVMDQMAHKAWNIYSLALYRKKLDPCFREWEAMNGDQWCQRKGRNSFQPLWQ